MLSGDSLLVQYIDDLLIASNIRDTCREDTITVLNHMVENGHKVTPSKLQYCMTQVVYLGHYFEKGVRKVPQERISGI